MTDRFSGKHFQTVFDFAPLGIAVADVRGRFLEANQAFLDMLGYTPQDILELTFHDITHPEDRAETERLSREVLEGRVGSYRQKKRYLTKDGRSLWAIVRATALRDPDGGFEYWLGIVEDITERVAAEMERERLAAQVQQSQKMEAIGTLARGIAHDFNNILMGIQGNVSLLLYNKPPGHREVPYLRKIEQAVERAARLTRQIIGFAGGGKYVVQPTDINLLLERSAKAFGRTCPGVVIRTRLQEGLWRVEADQAQIEQALVNLFKNSCEAMPDGGRLQLQTANVTVAAEDEKRPQHAAPGPYVRITVRDTGVGMDAEVRQRIFDPFFSTRELGQSTGLGLSAAHGIVANHQGFITVESEAGKGATFRVFLPAAGEPPVEAEPLEAFSPVAPRTILLVEDEEIVADIGEKMLKRMGHRVVLARSGLQALSIYRAQGKAIDLVILDVVMPEMSGGETFDHLKQIDPAVRVLLSSGFSLNGQPESIMSRGCRGFIQKPFSLGELAQKIEAALSDG
jgi:PAS domain S-box-containing protein